jgi:CYTH domain-containing protein
MGTEIERKFLLKNDGWRRGAKGIFLRQGYLTTDPERSVRVRLAGSKGVLTIKGQSSGCVRSEFEYPIPAEDASVLLENLCLRPLIEKVRYPVEAGSRLWVIDEFAGENRGLVVAEIELGSPDETFELPEWIGEEVTHDFRYYNMSLVETPFSQW